LNISDGGAVSTDTIYVVTTRVQRDNQFGTGSGTLTTRTLYASPSQLTGTGTINARGLVSDIDLVFGSAESLNQTRTFNQAGENVTTHLDMASSPSTMAISARLERQRLADDSKRDHRNEQHGLPWFPKRLDGVATVDGSGSSWTTIPYVGNSGSGTLNINGGAAVTVAGTTYVASGAVPRDNQFWHRRWNAGNQRACFASPTQLTGTGTINTMVW